MTVINALLTSFVVRYASSGPYVHHTIKMMCCLCIWHCKWQLHPQTFATLTLFLCGYIFFILVCALGICIKFKKEEKEPLFKCQSFSPSGLIGDTKQEFKINLQYLKYFKMNHKLFLITIYI